MAALLEKRVNGSGEGGADAVPVWELVGAGSVGAVLAALALCWPPMTHTISRGMVLLRSCEYVAAVMAGGWVVLRLLWAAFVDKPELQRGRLLLCAGVGWVFLPCLVMLGREQSLWMLPVAMVAAAVMTICVREFLPGDTESVEEYVMQRSSVPAFAEMPTASRGWWWAFGVSICLQAAAGLTLAGWIACASLLLAGGCCVMVWRWSERNRRRQESRKRSPARLLVAAVLAVLLAAVVQIPPANGGFEAVRAEVQNTPHRGTHYQSIILWPLLKKKEPPPPPDLHASAFGAGKAARPMVIPFDGPYWYVEAPETVPDPLAEVAHGDPVKEYIRTTDFLPLRMTAHQRLGSSVRMDCCAEMDVALTNGDRAAGEIDVVVVVTDNSTPGRPSVALGQQVIVSSEAKNIPFNRAPVDEVLRFRMPTQKKIAKFDEITVVFMTSGLRAHLGARVGLKEFRLMPR